jgi:ribosomal protein S18 acetylase RimI-like enzyme
LLPILPAMAGDLRSRLYRGPGDHPGMAEVMSEAQRADGASERITTAGLDAWIGNPRNMDPLRDIALVETPTGRIVALAIVRWTDRNTTSERSFDATCHVHPDFRRRGIGTALLAWGETRTGQIAAAMTELGDRPTIAVGYVYDTDVGGRTLLEGAGYHLARRSTEMARSDLLDIPEVDPPEGIAVGPIDPTDDEVLRRVWIVMGEVFSGHWGDPAPDHSESGWRRFRDHPDVQPEHWCVALDGHEIVGHILNYLAPDDDGSLVGWTEGIAVREGWRRRGIARAMLAWSLRRVRDAGAARAALGVDLENPNQALTLYESLGFRATVGELEYHRSLPAT